METLMEEPKPYPYRLISSKIDRIRLTLGSLWVFGILSFQSEEQIETLHSYFIKQNYTVNLDLDGRFPRYSFGESLDRFSGWVCTKFTFAPYRRSKFGFQCRWKMSRFWKHIILLKWKVIDWHIDKEFVKVEVKEYRFKARGL